MSRLGQDSPGMAATAVCRSHLSLTGGNLMESFRASVGMIRRDTAALGREVHHRDLERQPMIA